NNKHCTDDNPSNATCLQRFEIAIEIGIFLVEFLNESVRQK
ncbi:unnamed protein product, partial [Rotaria sordida]